jgi:beta-lactamase class A
MYLLGVFLLMVATSSVGAVMSKSVLQQSLMKLAAESDGRVGICVSNVTALEPVCVNGDQKFPLQSVMKLVVGAAVMEAIDHKKLLLSDVIVVRPENASPGPQDFANIVRSKGSLNVTIEELLRRAVVDSDSTSVDVLIERLGGVAMIQAFLKRIDADSINIDRDERHLQAESVGLVWKSEYADSDKFEVAVKSLPKEIQNAAWNLYLKDSRDTATPNGMAHFLQALARGKILSETSTQRLLAVMKATVTGRDRLKAGTPKGWDLGHKTGTGRTWQGITSATNDVGVLTAPDGGQVVVAVFVAESKRSNEQRAAIIANVAKLVTSAYLAEK